MTQQEIDNARLVFKNGLIAQYPNPEHSKIVEEVSAMFEESIDEAMKTIGDNFIMEDVLIIFLDKNKAYTNDMGGALNEEKINQHKDSFRKGILESGIDEDDTKDILLVLDNCIKMVDIEMGGVFTWIDVMNKYAYVSKKADGII